PVDASGFDYYTISGQKWIGGPDGTGGLVVRDPDGLEVAAPSYLAQASYDIAGAFVPVEGAPRFDGGSVSVATLAGLEAAILAIPEWGLARAAAVAERCRDHLAERFELVTAPAQRSTLVSFVPDGAPAEVVARLREAGVVVRDLPGTPWVRVSCGWWTS